MMKQEGGGGGRGMREIPQRFLPFKKRFSSSRQVIECNNKQRPPCLMMENKGMREIPPRLLPFKKRSSSRLVLEFNNNINIIEPQQPPPLPPPPQEEQLPVAVPEAEAEAEAVVVVMPVELRRYIEEKGGSHSEALMVIEKDLSATDVNSGHSRLSLPLRQLSSPDFLTPQEKQTLNLRSNNGRSAGAINVPLLQLPSLELTDVQLKRKKKKNGNRSRSSSSSSSYVICNNWNYVVTNNLLDKGCRIQIWSFRLHSILHLAIHQPPR